MQAHNVIPSPPLQVNTILDSSDLEIVEYSAAMKKQKILRYCCNVPLLTLFRLVGGAGFYFGILSTKYHENESLQKIVMS